MKTGLSLSSWSSKGVSSTSDPFGDTRDASLGEAFALDLPSSQKKRRLFKDERMSTIHVGHVMYQAVACLRKALTMRMKLSVNGLRST